MIETDNGETDTQPPVGLPSTCPLPAASRFQQMPELIRAAYVSPRSHWCYFKAHSARGHRIVVCKGKYVEARYIFGFSIITACKDHPFSWVIFNSLPSLRFVWPSSPAATSASTLHTSVTHWCWSGSIFSAPQLIALCVCKKNKGVPILDDNYHININQLDNIYTYTHTHTYIYIYMCVYMTAIKQRWWLHSTKSKSKLCITCGINGS